MQRDLLWHAKWRGMSPENDSLHRLDEHQLWTSKLLLVTGRAIWGKFPWRAVSCASAARYTAECNWADACRCGNSTVFACQTRCSSRGGLLERHPSKRFARCWIPMSALLCSGQRVWSAGCVRHGILRMRRLHCNEATPQVCAGECEAHLVEAVSALTSLSLTLPIDGMRLLEELRPLPIFCYEAR